MAISYYFARFFMVIAPSGAKCDEDMRGRFEVFIGRQNSLIQIINYFLRLRIAQGGMGQKTVPTLLVVYQILFRENALFFYSLKKIGNGLWVKKNPERIG